MRSSTVRSPDRPFPQSLLDRTSPIVDRLHVDAAHERRALIAGLLARPASIAPKYFYDAAGCALFAEICRLPEYYPTRTEAAIFDRYREEIAGAVGVGKQFIDLGAGDCRKGAAWIPWLQPSRYVAVDIAGDALVDALERLSSTHPDLDTRGIVTDFSRGLDLRDDIDAGPTLFFYPGSSIGNFSPADALRFLQSIRRHGARGTDTALLIGVDTKKDASRLQAAYDDAAGVTAEFNRNILLHVNRILGTAFAPSNFDHVTRYDAGVGRIEMHLQARTTQIVNVDGVSRTFEAGERIHTESSYKYEPEAFTAMLQRAGFSCVQCWQDDAHDFAVYVAR
jgi:dimethylhistidine N-methyltransferase